MGWRGMKKGTACYSVMQIDCQEGSILGTLAQHFFFFFGLMDSFFVGQSVGGVQGSRNCSLKHFQRHGMHSVMQEGNCYGLIRNHTVHIFTILNPVSMNSPCNACNLLYT